MDVRHLITFKKLAEYYSFTKTAESLGYTQSTITSHIQQLEATLEVKLLDRIGRKIILTNAGKELYENANELLKIYDKINEIKNCGKVEKGNLSISAPESMMENKIEEIIERFHADYPGITVSVKTGSCPTSYQSLINGDVDIAFLFLPVQGDERLEVKRISDEPLALVSKSDGKHDCFNSLINGNILDDTLILNEKNCSYRLTLESKLMENNISCSSTMELWSIEAIKRLVSKGVGISLLPLASVEKELKSGIMKIIDTSDMFKPVVLYLAYNKLRHKTKAMELFIEMAMGNATTNNKSSIL